jgi:protein TonB
MDTVADILANRGQDKFEWRLAVVGTILLHVSLGFALLTAAQSGPARQFVSPHAVSVRLVPLAALPGQQPPSPAGPSRPVIEKPEEAPAPSTKAMPLPEKSSKKTPPPPAHPSKTSPQAPRKAPTSVELPAEGESGAASEGPAGPASTFGASLSAFDSADFNYSYYVSQMLASIGANWFKPTDQAVTPPVVYFRIGRDGSISGATVERSSGFSFIDRAALRAVLASSPLPPLPADFHQSSLGVHLKFE